FMVAPGKVNLLDETRGQEEIGHRYYEGAAAGTVMIGQAPNCDSFWKMFPWSDAVIKIQPDGSDVIDVIAKLDRVPERVLAISQKNASEALLRHDWVYRWKELLQVAGLDPTPATFERTGGSYSHHGRSVFFATSLSSLSCCPLAETGIGTRIRDFWSQSATDFIFAEAQIILRGTEVRRRGVVECD